MSETPTHFQSPFSFAGNGSAILDSEGSAANILSNTYNVCVCPEGVREDLPEYGIPQLEFQTVPLQLAGFEEAIRRWEPRANPQTSEQAVALIRQSERVLTVEVGGE